MLMTKHVCVDDFGEISKGEECYLIFEDWGLSLIGKNKTYFIKYEEITLIKPKRVATTIPGAGVSIPGAIIGGILYGALGAALMSTGDKIKYCYFLDVNYRENGLLRVFSLTMEDELEHFRVKKAIKAVKKKLINVIDKD